MKNINLYSLIKFGNEENIHDLYNNGTLYLNTLEYFKKLEDKNLRGDSYEGVLEIINYPPGKINFDFKNGNTLKNIPYENLHLRKTPQKLLGNIFCLYAIRPVHLSNANSFKLDLRNQAFGSHFLMLTNNGIQEFLDKVFDVLADKKIPYDYGFVNYYNRFSINQKLDIFMKPDDYMYQNEFRIYAQHLIDEPLKINIGSLKHIAKIYETKLLPHFEIERNDHIPILE